jgi:hypothetical protein
VLRDGLPAHFAILTKLAERLTIVRMQSVQKLPAIRISERFENFRQIHGVRLCNHTVAFSTMFDECRVRRLHGRAICAICPKAI